MKNGHPQTESLLESDADRNTNHASVTLYGGTDTTRQPSKKESNAVLGNEGDNETIDGDWESLGGSESENSLPLFTLISILSTAFSYGCILTTLFLITLPIECNRINKEHPDIPKSVALGNFVAIAGVTQLVSPLVGRLSDTYIPPAPHEIGQRMPYLLLGSIFTVTGLLLQTLASYQNFWIRYSFAFFLHMSGLNIMYAMMLALIPDQVPVSQTGVANGVLALLLVTGSLFGFGLFHSFLGEDIQNMYGLYTCIVIVTTILTGTHAHDRDAELAYIRAERRRRRSESLAGEVEEKQADQNSLGQKIKNKAREIVLTPTLILKSILVDPVRQLDRETFFNSYTIDLEKHHDFFVVTVSRLFYYCGMSVQTFFLYFVHDIIHVKDHPEAVVASLAILSQIAGAVTCYPVGVISDRWLGGRRKPFVYLACALLSSATLLLTFATTLHEMAILCIVLGAANGIYLTMDTSLAVDTLPRNRNGDDDNGSAQLLGIWGVAAFLGSALGPMIGGPLLYFFGQKHDSDADSDVEEYSLTGYAVVLSLSTFYFICSALSLQYIKNHHE
jgi:MFS family permease